MQSENMWRDTSTTGLNPPKDTSLPYFAYGLFRPDGPAYRQIQKLVEGNPVKATAPGSLWARDGLPLLKIDTSGCVRGYVMSFHDDDANRAYCIISRFEPRQHYCWEKIELQQPKKVANALVGRRPERASVQIEEGEWTAWQDPVLTVGLDIVRQAAEKHARQEFTSAPPDSFEWPRLFHLQMAYLLLWTIIERYTALSYGPGLKPMERIKCLGEDQVFKSALQRKLARQERIYDSRDPEDSARLDRKDGPSSAKYYYLVRNNLSHRGKGAWKDGEIVRRSLRELLDIFCLVLKENERLKENFDCCL
jgi:gamma-glutamylcyclotransferase (GGCT)/AIG2-like uncharacterized protein YtfP